MVECFREGDPARIVGPIAGGENHGSKTAETEGVVGAGDKRRGRRHLWRGHALRLTSLRDEATNIGVAGIAERHGLGQVRSEMSRAVFNPKEVAKPADAQTLQCSVVEIMASTTTT